jgi:hypothetical protein
MKLSALGDRHFHSILAALCLFYLALQAIYVTRLPLVMDEFAGMVTVLDHRSGIPYRDFIPYKTVLGYYIQTLPTFLTDDTWTRLIATKLFLAALNTIAIFWIAGRLATLLRPSAVIIATLMLVCMSTFLERSSELRVDMLTSIGGLAGLIWLLERRLVAAGIATGVALLISQKAAFFCLAGAAALTAEWALSRERITAIREGLLFAIGILVPLALYLTAFSLLAGPEKVFNQVFAGPSPIAFSEAYDIRHYWTQTVSRNPLFWGLTFLSIILLLRHFEQRLVRMVCVYGTVILLLAIWYKQPWPYFFVIIIPTCYVLLAVFFANTTFRDIRQRNAAAVALLILGVAYPLSRIDDNLNRDNGFQRHSIEIAEALLAEDETYFAGIELIPTRRHVPSSLKWLDVRRVAALRAQSDYDSLIGEMRESGLKLVIFNYRVIKLPEPLLTYIRSNYKRLVGAVMIYAPTIPAGAAQTEILMPGTYRILASANSQIVIDGNSVAAGDAITLDLGPHHFDANEKFRLQLQTPPLPQPRHPNNIAPQFFFPNVYRY